MRVSAIFHCFSSSPAKIYKTSVGWKDKQAIHAAWKKWASEGEAGEQRDTAVLALKDCFKRNAASLSLTELNLRTLPDILPPSITSLFAQGNKLTRLPILPEFLESLDVSDNHLEQLPHMLPEFLKKLAINENYLERLPENLPDSLIFLEARDNCLTCLPERLPSSLRNLDCAGNNLSQLSHTLPDSLVRLDLHSNQLERLSVNFPNTLTYLDLNENFLSEVPVEIAGLSPSCFVLLFRNSFSDEAVQSIQASTQAQGYTGPFIRIVELLSRPVETFESCISSWFPSDRQFGAASAWRKFKAEDGAKQFLEFIKRLSGGPLRQHPEFKSTIGEWLSQLAERPSLRNLTFAIAVEASSSCDDRILLGLNQMHRAYVQDDVDKGMYDGTIRELIAVGRETFRQLCLEEIATGTMQDFVFAESLFSLAEKTDEIEVYLGYQVKLRDVLQLKSLARDMTYFQFADLTDGHLKVAERTVKKKENSDFAVWLTRWPAWDTVLQRVDTENFNISRDWLLEEMSEPLQEKVTTEMNAMNLPFCEDTRRGISNKIWGEIQDAEKMKLTTTFLEENGLTAELAPFWNLKTLEANPEITHL